MPAYGGQLAGHLPRGGGLDRGGVVRFARGLARGEPSTLERSGRGVERSGGGSSEAEFVPQGSKGAQLGRGALWAAGWASFESFPFRQPAGCKPSALVCDLRLESVLVP